MRLFAFALLATTTFAVAARKPPEPQQFLDRSIVTLPKSAADYTLAEAAYDPEQFQAGITSKWKVNGAPADLKLTVFAYPLGRFSEEEAVAQQIADVEKSLRDAVKLGHYSDLTVGDRTPFLVVAPKDSILELDEKVRKQGGRPFDPMPRPEPKPKVVADDADIYLRLAAETQRSPNSHGLRQSFRFRQDGIAMRSLGYVFYRHLFAFKVRVSVPEDSMDEATFNALADSATRNLVPRIDVQNYGTCGNIEVDANTAKGKDKDTPSPEFAAQLIRGAARVLAENCGVSEDKKLSRIPSRTKRIEIEYPRGTWGSTD